jgi:hypothetical protein
LSFIPCHEEEHGMVRGCSCRIVHGWRLVILKGNSCTVDMFGGREEEEATNEEPLLNLAFIEGMKGK